MDAAPAQPRLSSRRLAMGAAFLILAPVAAYAATRPIASPTGILGTGGAAKGVAPLVDYEAPNFKLRDPSGKDVELKQLRGKPVLLNFWATWCVPCREEMPELELLYREHKAKGLIVLAVSVDAEQMARDIPEFLKEGDPAVGAYTFPVALDTKQEVQKQYKLLGVPQSFFIDPAGVIRVIQPRVMNKQMMMDGLQAVMPGNV